MSELKVSGVVWKRMRNILITGTIFGGIGGGIVYAVSGDKLVLNAEGLVTQDKVVIASPYDARLRQVFVRPGDRVEAGQPVAAVESATLSRTLAELSGERAKLTARNAQIEGRARVVESLLPMAQEHSKVAGEYLTDLKAAKTRGLMIDRTVHEISAIMLAAEERTLGLIGEMKSLDLELGGNKQALRDLEATYDNLQKIFDQGILRAPVAGIIGATVGAVGEMLAPGSSKVAQIHTGEAYALAYLPDSYLFDVEEGQPVAVKGRGRSVTAYIKQILPVTEELPAEFQNPNRSRLRGQMVRIELEDRVNFAVDQKIQVTSCYITGCKHGLVSIARKAGNSAIAWLNDAVHQARVTEALMRRSWE